jgi:hypothetical protein
LKLGFEWDSLGTAGKKCLSELADHRKIHGTAMFLHATAKTLLSYQNQRCSQAATEMERNRL